MRPHVRILRNPPSYSKHFRAVWVDDDGKVSIEGGWERNEFLALRSLMHEIDVLTTPVMGREYVRHPFVDLVEEKPIGYLEYEE